MVLEAKYVKFRTNFLVFPEHLNPAGSLFGGELMARMDVCAASTAKRFLYGTTAYTAVTVHVTDLTFKIPGKLGDLVLLGGEVVSAGNTSITIRVKVSKEEMDTGKHIRMTEGTFIFVAVDKNGNKVPHERKLKSDG